MSLCLMTLASKSGVGVDFLAFLNVENYYSYGNPPSLLSHSEPSYASSLVYTELFSVPRMLMFVLAAKRKLVGDCWLMLSSSSTVKAAVPRLWLPTPRLTGFIKLSISLT